MRVSVRRSLAVLSVAIAAGCQAHVPYAISDKDKHRFAAGIIDVRVPGRPPLIEGLDGCTVWKAQYTGDEITGWKAALGADWGGTYPRFLTACMGQKISYRDHRVNVYLCARAIGAGGGCNNGGYYWSYTGERPWHISNDRVNWAVLPP